MFEIKGKVATAICYAKVVEDEAIEQIRSMCDYALTEGSRVRIMPDVRLTILIGAYSIRYYLKDRAGKNLTETVRSFAQYLPEYFPIVHPSPLNFRWQAKNPWFEEQVVPELQKRVAEILAK